MGERAYRGLGWVVSAALYVLWCIAIYQQKKYPTLVLGLVFYGYTFMAHGSLPRMLSESFGDVFGTRDTPAAGRAKRLCLVASVVGVTTVAAIGAVLRHGV